LTGEKMGENANFYLNPKDATLSYWKGFFEEYPQLTQTVILFFETGISQMRRNIIKAMPKSQKSNDIPTYAEDEFSFLDKVMDDHSKLILTMMYSQCEKALKDCLCYLGSENLDRLNCLDKLKGEFKGKHNIHLPSLPNYQHLSDYLRSLNNDIKHNGGIASKDISPHSLYKSFRKGEAIVVENKVILTLAENISEFMLSVIKATRDKKLCNNQ